MGSSKLSKPKIKSISKPVSTEAINKNPGIFVFSANREVTKRVVKKNTVEPTYVLEVYGIFFFP